MSKISKNGLRSKRKMRRNLERIAQEEIDHYLYDKMIPDLEEVYYEHDPHNKSGPMFDRFGNGPSPVYAYLDPVWHENWDFDYDPIEYDSCYEDLYEEPYDELDFHWHSFGGTKIGAVKSEFTLIMGIEEEPASWYKDRDDVLYMMVVLDGDLYLANSQTGLPIYWGPRKLSTVQSRRQQ